MTERTTTLLVVDDEETNRFLIGEYLDGLDYQLDYAEDGRQAWAMLQDKPDAYDAVLLDRMMPHMNGIELLTRMKQDARLNGIPVILQTAAASAEQIEEGMRLGAYYYLAKPFPMQALKAVVATALGDSRNQRTMQEALRNTQHVLHLLCEARFRFRGMDEARSLAAELANRAATPGTVVVGLTELLVNAVEHGNLEIHYQEKGRLLEKEGWDAEIQRRLQDPLYAGRHVSVTCHFDNGIASLLIEDQGAGFDWRQYLQLSPERAFDLHGRGIAMARQLSFTSLEYLGNGNTVKVTFPLA